jgi:hypothetical protein
MKIVALAGLLLSGLAAWIAPSALAGADSNQLKVTSSLDGRTVLPHRIHWLARPKGAAKVVEVDFLIDGKVSWVERNAPYSYGDDGNWLVTSALAPGRHRFTVRAKAAHGITAQRTTIARVLPAMPPPAELAGSWERTVTQEQAGKDTPAGTWTISVDTTGWKVKDPQGFSNWIDVAYLSSNLLEARSGIWTQPSGERVQLGGNGWCGDSYAPVDYGWAVATDTLTLTLNGPDRCGAADARQDFIWAGAWTRVG